MRHNLERHKHKGEHERKHGGHMPEGPARKEHDKMAEHGEKKMKKEHHVARKRGGHVPGKKAEHRPDKRARGGGVGADTSPLTHAGEMNELPYTKGTTMPTKSEGEGKDRE